MKKLLIAFVLVALSGCGTVDKRGVLSYHMDEAAAVVEWFKTRPDMESSQAELPGLVDQIPIGKIVFHGRRDPGGYMLSHDLVFQGKYGGQVRFVQMATSEWPNPKKWDVIGTVWVLIPRKDGTGKWDGYQTDYIRPGTQLRHWPWASRGEKYDYPAIGPSDSFGCMLSTLARDWRKNGEFRTITVKVR